MRDLLSGYKDKEGFDTEKKDIFFGNEENVQNLGVSQEQFDILDQGQQLQVLTEK
jgi:hypothetical protein